MTIQIKIRCEGVTPILFNRKTPEMLQALWDKSKAPKNAGRPLPREHAQKCLYTDEIGAPYLPGEMLMSALIAAGQQVRLDGRRQISTAKSTVLPGFLTLLDARMPLTPGDWEVDLRGGVNPNGGEAVCIVRPRFDRWGFETNVLVEDTEIDESKIRELFDKAGSSMGLGDFRPQRKGIFGKFRVVCWERQTAPHEHAAE